MIKFHPDDSDIVPANDTAGAIFLTEIEAKAKVIYPDHSGSREAYVREKVAEEITRLREIEFRMQGLEK